MTPPEHAILAALRVVAFHGSRGFEREARKRIDGQGDPIVHALILLRQTEEPASHWPTPDDHRTVLLGALAANPDHLPLYPRAAEAGCSLRDIGEVVGVSHTAVRRRIDRAA